MRSDRAGPAVGLNSALPRPSACRIATGPVIGEVMRMALAGGAPETIAQSRHRPYAIAVDSGRVYWADQGTSDATHICSLTDGSIMRPTRDPHEDPHRSPRGSFEILMRMTTDSSEDGNSASLVLHPILPRFPVSRRLRTACQSRRRAHLSIHTGTRVRSTRVGIECIVVRASRRGAGDRDAQSPPRSARGRCMRHGQVVQPLQAIWKSTTEHPPVQPRGRQLHDKGPGEHVLGVHVKRTAPPVVSLQISLLAQVM
jgi:hypothetical protein